MTYISIPYYLATFWDPLNSSLNCINYLKCSPAIKCTIIIFLCTSLWYCISDCVRTYALIVTVLSVGLQGLISIPQILAFNSKNCSDRLKIEFCKSISLVHKLMKEAVEIYVSMTLSTIFWTLSILIGVLVRKYDDIPFTIFGLLLCIALTTGAAITVGLHAVSTITQKWDKVIKICRTACWLDYVKSRNLNLQKLRKIIWFEAKALQSIEIRYKPFTTISKSFMMHYLQSVRDRVFDMILIF